MCGASRPGDGTTCEVRKRERDDHSWNTGHPTLGEVLLTPLTPTANFRSEVRAGTKTHPFTCLDSKLLESEQGGLRVVFCFVNKCCIDVLVHRYNDVEPCRKAGRPGALAPGKQKSKTQVPEGRHKVLNTYLLFYAVPTGLFKNINLFQGINSLANICHPSGAFFQNLVN